MPKMNITQNKFSWTRSRSKRHALGLVLFHFGFIVVIIFSVHS